MMNNKLKIVRNILLLLALLLFLFQFDSEIYAACGSAGCCSRGGMNYCTGSPSNSCRGISLTNLDCSGNSIPPETMYIGTTVVNDADCGGCQAGWDCVWEEYFQAPCDGCCIGVGGCGRLDCDINSPIGAATDSTPDLSIHSWITSGTQPPERIEYWVWDSSGTLVRNRYFDHHNQGLSFNPYIWTVDPALPGGDYTWKATVWNECHNSTECLGGSFTVAADPPPTCEANRQFLDIIPVGTTRGYTVNCSDPGGGVVQSRIIWGAEVGSPPPPSWGGSVTCAGSTCSTTVTWNTVGDFWWTVDAIDTTGQGCSGNPWCEWQPEEPNFYNCSSLGYSDCTGADLAQVRVVPVATATPVPTAVPPPCGCVIDTRLDDTSIDVGSSTMARVGINCAGGASVGLCSFSEGSLTSVNPAIDMSSPFETQVTCNAEGVNDPITTICGVVGMCGPPSPVTDLDFIDCQAVPVPPTPIPPPECDVNLSPGSGEACIGRSDAFQADVFNIRYGSVSRVRFVSDDSSIFTPVPGTVFPPPAYFTSAVCSAAGSADLTAYVDMGIGNSGVCEDFSTMTCRAPDCNISGPANVNVDRGATATLGVNISGEVCGTVSSATFSSADTDVATVTSPDNLRSGSEPHFTSTVRGIGTDCDFSTSYTARARMTDGSTCDTDSGTINVNPPSCSFDLNNSLPLPPLTVGDSVELRATDIDENLGCFNCSGGCGECPTCGGGTGILFFEAIDPANAIELVAYPGETNPDCEVAYHVQVNAIGPGNAAITAEATMDDGCTDCNASGAPIVPIGIYYAPWFQVYGGDLSAGSVTTGTGALRSRIPATAIDPVVIPDGSLTNPALERSEGVGVYYDSTGINPPNFGSGTISTPGWLVNNAYAGPIYDYAYFENKLATGVGAVANILDSDMNTADWNGGDSYGGYEWYFYAGAGGDLRIDEAIDFANRKVVLMVNNANLIINEQINLNDGQGFFMAIVNGDITVPNAVGGAPGGNTAHLEGIFIVDGQFITETQGIIGTADNQLIIRGSVTAAGFDLQRNLVADNDTLPAEIIEFAPDLLFNYPQALSAKRIEWKEVAP